MKKIIVCFVLLISSSVLAASKLEVCDANLNKVVGNYNVMATNVKDFIAEINALNKYVLKSKQLQDIVDKYTQQPKKSNETKQIIKQN